MSNFNALAHDDFNRARSRAFFSSILSLLKLEKDELLSLQEVRDIIKPGSEFYRGMKAVPISLISGSEGRYRDFTKYFLPRHRHLRGRWERVDLAHHKQVILPAIKLYEIGGIYFVRDGNHRVSVARAQRVEFIDAEVISLNSRVKLKANMTAQALKNEVITLEKKEFFAFTGLAAIRPQAIIEFSATGRYDEIIRHINGHKYYLNQAQEKEISFADGMISWFDNIYRPIIKVIAEEKILKYFPGRTGADLYVWIVRHWDVLKQKYGEDFTLKEAAVNFRSLYGKHKNKGWVKRLLLSFKNIHRKTG
ncbi:MAG: transcriptional regulator [Spirochaeta sp.]|nr:transcriptional regulator [Spirochaeta sp.]